MATSAIVEYWCLGIPWCLGFGIWGFRHRRSILVELGVNQLFEFLQRLIGIWSFAPQTELRTLTCCQHHQSHDALAVHFLSLFGNPHVRAVAAGNSDKHGRRTGMQPKT